MNEKIFEKSLDQLAEQGIPTDPDLWPSVRARLPRRANSAGGKLRTRVAGALLALVAVILLTPAAQAELMKLLDKIAGISFLQTDEYPGGDGPVTIIPDQYMSLDEALEKYPFNLPTWTPEGFTLNQEVKLFLWTNPDERPPIELDWQQNGVTQFSLSIQLNTNEWVVGPDSVEPLDIEGREAALWRGGWNYDTKEWDPSISGVTISWAQDDLAYHLSTYDDGIPIETLIEIIASMPE